MKFRNNILVKRQVKRLKEEASMLGVQVKHVKFAKNTFGLYVNSVFCLNFDKATDEITKAFMENPFGFSKTK